MAIEFWFDFASSYSYPAAMSIQALADQHKQIILWRPFLLGEIFNKQGWHDSPFNLYPVKGAYMWRDLYRVCKTLNIPFTRPDKFPRNGLLAARVVTRFADALWISTFIKSVFVANFADDQDISSPQVIARCLEACGEPAKVVLQEANSLEVKAQLRKQTELAYARGIFGAPSFYVNGELFWGNDRLSNVFEWALNNEPQAGI